MYDETICGTCKFHRKDRNTDEWVCTNPESDAYGLETDYRDTCDGQEERQKGGW